VAGYGWGGGQALDPTTTAGFCRGRIEALMSRRPPLTTSSDPRPASAIYLGDAKDAVDNPLFTPPQDPRLLPHQLPSPPHTNSTSGSAGDKDSSSSGSIRLPAALLRESLREHQTMLNGGSPLAQSTSTVGSEEVDPDELTARLPDDRRESESDESAFARRALSVTDRNRKVSSSLVIQLVAGLSLPFHPTKFASIC
jgi:hypothetical protein